MQANKPEVISIKIHIKHSCQVRRHYHLGGEIEENSVIFLDPPDNRILAVTEMEQPKTKKDVQRLCGMISSLKPWFPSINFATKALRGACGSNSKFIWTPEMNLEFEIMLSPFNPDREINILIDAGVGYCFYQN